MELLRPKQPGKRLNEQEKLYCIGDSHVSFFSGSNNMINLWPYPAKNYIEGFRCFRIGAVLAHNLIQYNTKMKGREIIMTLLNRGVSDELKIIPSNSDIMFCFGEIDCRAHVMKQSNKRNIPVSAVLKTTVDRYSDFLTEIQDLGFNIHVWNVIPNCGESYNPEFPSFGSTTQRINIAKEFNAYLKEFCDRSSMKFISIFDLLLDKNGSPLKEYYLDSIHLSQSALKLLKDRYNDYFNFAKTKQNLIEIINERFNSKITPYR